MGDRMEQKQYLEAAKHIFKDVLNLTSPSVDHPKVLWPNYDRVFAGNLCLKVFDLSQQPTDYFNEASRYEQLVMNKKERFLARGTCSYEGAIVGWYLTAKD